MISKRIYVVISLVLVLVIYGAFWLYLASEYKAQAQLYVEELKKNVGSVGGTLNLDPIDIRGFPLRLDARISKLSFSINIPGGSGAQGSSVRVSTQQETRLSYPLFSKTLRLEMPAVMDVVIQEGEISKTHRARFTGVPYVVVESEQDIIALLTQSDDDALKRFYETLRSFVYQDYGMQIETESGELLYSTKGSQISFYCSLREQMRDIRLTIQLDALQGTKSYYETLYANVLGGPLGADEQKNQHEEIKNFFINQSVATDPSSYLLKLHYQGDDMLAENAKIKKFRLNIEDYNFASARYGLKSKGFIALDESELLPFGDVELVVSNYSALIDYLAHVVQLLSLPAGSPADNPLLSSEQGKVAIARAKESYAMFLSRIATVDEVNKTAQLKIVREPGKEVLVNGKNIGQVMEIVQSTMGNNLLQPVAPAQP